MDGEALEVAQHDRKAEGRGEPLDLDVQRLGLLAGHDRLVGRRGRRLDGMARSGVRHGAGLLDLATAGEPEPGTTRRAKGDAIEPVAQQVGVADRPRLPRQHEEGGLEGVLGEVAVGEDLPADAQHHRAMTRDQGGEGGLGVIVSPRDKLLQELPVGEPGRRAAREERPELPGHRPCCQIRHGRRLSRSGALVARASSPW